MNSTVGLLMFLLSVAACMASAGSISREPVRDSLITTVSPAVGRPPLQAEVSRLDAERCLENGIALAQKGEYADAADSFRSAIEQGLCSPDVYNNLGNALMAQGFNEEAITQYTIAVGKDSKSWLYYHNRGNARLATGDTPGAIRDYSDALALKDDGAATYEARGRAFLALNEFEHAITDYGQAITLGGADWNLFSNRGVAYRHLERFAEAMTDFTKAIELAPLESVPYLNRGIARQLAGDYHGAISDLEKAVDLKQGDPAMLLALGDAAFLAGDGVRAAKAYRRAIENGADCGAHASLANSLFVLGDFRGAESSYENAMASAKVSSPYWAFLRYAAQVHVDGTTARCDWGVAPIKEANQWTTALGQYLARTRTFEATRIVAENDENGNVRGKQCELLYYAGIVSLSEGKKEIARSFFEKCLGTGERTYTEFVLARAELSRLVCPDSGTNGTD